MKRESGTNWSALDDAQQRGAAHLASKALAFEKLLEISRQISTLDLDRALRLILESLLALTRTRRGVAMLVRGKPDDLYCEACVPMGRRDVAGPTFDVSRSIIEQAIDQRELVRITEVVGSEVAHRPSVVALGLHALMAIPLVARDRVVGALYVDTNTSDHRLGQLGTDVLGAFASQAAIAIDNARQYQTLHAHHALLLRGAHGPSSYGGLRYQSHSMDEACRLLRRVEASDVAVMILGETGTGKGLAARALHDQGRRHARPFLQTNVGAIPDTLLTSTLFGHRRGAFSGAETSVPGLFESAYGGTLFLDEIGEASTQLQVALLHVLDNGTVCRLGETREREVDVRIVAATHRDLAAEVAAGRFRQDLFYRLNIYPVTMPPLRDRPEDIPILTETFLTEGNRSLGTDILTVPPSTLATWRAKPWPGNVRQLRNTVQRLMILSSGSMLETPEANGAVAESSTDGAPLEPAPDLALPTLAEVERKHLVRVLEAAGGNKSLAARILDLKRGTLRSRLAKHDLGH